MDAIGGYFGLELGQGEASHKNAIKLNTARNCFEYVLKVRQYKKVYIPYFTCEVMLEPLKKTGVSFEFYSINEVLEPKEIPSLRIDEAFLYTNYFGLKQQCVEYLAGVYGSQLIVDNAQAFYAPRIDGIDTFYSPRKFFGVADGGYLYTDKLLDDELEQDYSFDRMSHLLKRIDLSAEDGYSDFRKNDEALVNQPTKKMSKLTDSILSSIDYEGVKSIRKRNFAFIHNNLKNVNRLNVQLDQDAVPMVYPFLTSDNELKQRLIRDRVYVATYWSNVLEWVNSNDWEYTLAERLIPLPIDQRYTIEDIKKITQ